jgi:ABC-type uncharacterized transport system permease subunit
MCWKLIEWLWQRFLHRNELIASVFIAWIAIIFIVLLVLRRFRFRESVCECEALRLPSWWGYHKSVSRSTSHSRPVS